MKGLYGSPALPFWGQAEILKREQFTASILLALESAMKDQNQAWRFERTDGPILTPAARLAGGYGDDDVWALVSPLKGGSPGALRPETTPSSYAYAAHLLGTAAAKMPLCVWQAGKSFRRETNDGARASTLRFNEFYQLEFQLIHSPTTKADVFAQAEAATREAIRRIAGPVRCVPSDRLPAYSAATVDVEAMWRGQWKEMCSISRRLDYEGASVVEVAIGLDRLVQASAQAPEGEPPGAEPDDAE